MKRNTILLGIALLGGLGLIWALNTKRTPEGTAKVESHESDDFVTTPDGIRYCIEKQGQGPTPEKGENVTVHYTGWLDVEGKQDTDPFDSSITRGRPFSFNVGAGTVIPGWDITLAEMKEGEVRYIILPAQLAYGAIANSKIPANSTLRFRIELLKVG
jgi:peptidylprolyl isomerase